MEKYFEEMIKGNLWDGRIVNIPFLFTVVSLNENGRFKSHELAKIEKNGELKFLNN